MAEPTPEPTPEEIPETTQDEPEAEPVPLLTLADGLPPVPEGVTAIPSRRGQRGT